MDKPERIRAKGDSGSCRKPISKRKYSKKRRTPNRVEEKLLQNFK